MKVIFLCQINLMNYVKSILWMSQSFWVIFSLCFARGRLRRRILGRRNSVLRFHLISVIHTMIWLSAVSSFSLIWSSSTRTLNPIAKGVSSVHLINVRHSPKLVNPFDSIILECGGGAENIVKSVLPRKWIVHPFDKNFTRWINKSSAVKQAATRQAFLFKSKP